MEKTRPTKEAFKDIEKLMNEGRKMFVLAFTKEEECDCGCDKSKYGIRILK